MNNILKSIRRFRKTLLHFKQYSTNSGTQHSPPTGTSEKSYGWLLVFPIATFGLGTWQVRRLEWKKGLIRDMEERTQSPPSSYDTRDMLIPGRAAQMEYKPVYVDGHYDYSKEILLGPRVRNDKTQRDPTGLIAHGKAEVGYHIIAPFVLDNGDRILVNRGWVSSHQKSQDTRKEGQVRDRVHVSGLVRKGEGRPQFSPKVKEDSLNWNYCDVYGFSNILNTLPLIIDADEKSCFPGGPIGGQTRVTMRNEHLNYVITWYSLSAATLLLWFQLRKRPTAMFKGPKTKEI